MIDLEDKISLVEWCMEIKKPALHDKKTIITVWLLILEGLISTRLIEVLIMLTSR